MKKLILLSFIVLNTLPIKAQMDTIQFGIEHRDSTYYYHCWIDEHLSKLQWEHGYWVTNFIPYILAKPFYTDIPLNIIGIACVTEIVTRSPYNPNSTTPVSSDTVPEYFELYEATDTSFEKIASTRWDTIKPTKYMYFENNTPVCPPISPIYEAYFDSARTVFDSFYIAITFYNNVPSWEPDGYGNMEYQPYFPMTYPSKIMINNIINIDSSLLPCMPYIKRKYIPVEGDFYEYYFDFYPTDTTVWYYSNNIIAHIPMFPIFDTTGYYTDTCADVSNFSLVSMDMTSATFSWGNNTSEHIGWQIAYGEDGMAVENCTVVNTTSTVHCLSNLDSAKWYVAYVRAMCDTNDYSNWSDSIRFYITGDTTTVNIRNTVLENYTHIIPNPASDMVNIFSSFSIRKVEVYSLKGVKVKEEGVKAASIKMDISNLPKGTYLVKVYTPNGVATKKLIIN